MKCRAVTLLASWGSQQSQCETSIYSMDKKEICIFSDLVGQLEGGESRWVGEEEGEGPCLQMLLVWTLGSHRDGLERYVAVNKVA